MFNATPLPLYAIALGSNRRHALYGDPRRILLSALEAIECDDVEPVSVSPIIASAPIGPSRRTYANAVALVASLLTPPQMLQHLQTIEAAFGRRTGRRWGARTLDLDIILWSGGMWSDPELIVPHPAFRQRPFVIDPLAKLVPNWRDPLTGATMRQLAVKLRRRKPVDHCAAPL